MSKIEAGAPKRKDLCQCGARGWVYYRGQTTFYRCGKCGTEWPRVLATKTNKLKDRCTALEALAVELAGKIETHKAARTKSGRAGSWSKHDMALWSALASPLLAELLGRLKAATEPDSMDNPFPELETWGPGDWKNAGRGCEHTEDYSDEPAGIICVGGWMIDVDTYHEGYDSSDFKRPCPSCNTAAYVQWHANEMWQSEGYSADQIRTWVAENTPPTTQPPAEFVGVCEDVGGGP